jgi:hypothetical protein
MYHILFGALEFGWLALCLSSTTCSYSAFLSILMGIFAKAIGALEFGQLQYRLVLEVRAKPAIGEGKQF